MKKEWRYKIERIGDAFAECVEDVIDLASGSASGVVIGYHIHKINRKTRKVATRVGERVIEMRRDDPDLLSYDAKMREIFADLDELQKVRDKYVKEREEIKQRRKHRVKRYGAIFEPEASKTGS
jgi:vacuolar-type H+-ATPase subunit I/STV1